MSSIRGEVNVVISHFHPDHMANLKRLSVDDVFVGKNTYKYTGFGTIIEQNTMVDDIYNIEIIPMPSSHAKGCLALEVNEKYLFVGDALYPKQKNESRLYNVQHLHQQIMIIESLKVDYIGISHRDRFILQKDGVVEWLKSIYDRRMVGEAFIEVV